MYTFHNGAPGESYDFKLGTYIRTCYEYTAVGGVVKPRGFIHSVVNNVRGGCTAAAAQEYLRV